MARDYTSVSLEKNTMHIHFQNDVNVTSDVMRVGLSLTLSSKFYVVNDFLFDDNLIIYRILTFFPHLHTYTTLA